MNASPPQRRPSLNDSVQPAAATPHQPADTNEHEYLRKYVDPVLMPLIEALLLYQPECIYEFIHDFVDESKSDRFSHQNQQFPYSRYTKKLSKRQQMVDYMATSVIPIMDDLAHQILRERPSSVKGFIKDIVQARIIVGSGDHALAATSNQDNDVVYAVNDRVLCRYKGRPRYWPATITAFDPQTQLYTVQYGDGKTEHSVHGMCLKPDTSAAPTMPNVPDKEPTLEESTDPKDSTSVMDENRDAAPASEPKSLVVLIIGIDNAGKSTLLSTLQEFQTETGYIKFYDLGGGPAFRNVWPEYYADVHGIIFVVDSADQNSIHEAAQVLSTSMSHSMMVDKPLLIFANKRDDPSVMEEQELRCLLHTDDRPNTMLMPCIAKASQNNNMVDDRLEQGLHWLLEKLDQDFGKLQARVRSDIETKKQEVEARRAAQRNRVSAWREENERQEMMAHDKYDSQEINEKGTATTKEESPEAHEEDVIMCSSCKSQPAVAKCAASKWMPVCQECADRLKSNQS